MSSETRTLATRAELWDLVLQISDQELTGLLALSGENPFVMQLDNGRVSGVDGTVPDEVLAESFVTAGLVSEQAMGRVQATARVSRSRLGRILGDLGMMSPGDDDIAPEEVELGGAFKYLLGCDGPWEWRQVSHDPGDLSLAIPEQMASAFSATASPRELTDWAGRFEDLRPVAVPGGLPVSVREFLHTLDPGLELRDILKDGGLPPRDALAWIAISLKAGWIANEETEIVDDSGTEEPEMIEEDALEEVEILLEEDDRERAAEDESEADYDDLLILGDDDEDTLLDSDEIIIGADDTDELPPGDDLDELDAVLAGGHADETAELEAGDGDVPLVLDDEPGPGSEATAVDPEPDMAEEEGAADEPEPIELFEEPDGDTDAEPIELVDEETDPEPTPEPAAAEPASAADGGKRQKFFEKPVPDSIYQRLGLPDGAAGQGIAQAYSKRFRRVQKLLSEEPASERLAAWKDGLLEAYRILSHTEAATLYEKMTTGAEAKGVAATVMNEMGQRALDRGLGQIREGVSFEGAKSLQESLSWRTDLPEAWVALGFYQASLEDDEETQSAVESFTKALELDPDNGTYRYYRAVAADFAGMPDVYEQDKAWLAENPAQAPGSWSAFESSR